MGPRTKSNSTSNTISDYRGTPVIDNRWLYRSGGFTDAKRTDNLQRGCPHWLLDTAQTIKVVVFEISPGLDTTIDSIALTEHLIDELATSVSVDREQQD